MGDGSWDLGAGGWEPVTMNELSAAAPQPNDLGNLDARIIASRDEFSERGCVRSTSRSMAAIPARCGWVFDHSRSPFWLQLRRAAPYAGFPIRALRPIPTPSRRPAPCRRPALRIAARASRPCVSGANLSGGTPGPRQSL